jgi:hypothetical protein
MLLGITDLSNGVTVVSGSRVTIANTGIYNIQWSAQFTNPTSAEHDVTIWLRKNGVDVPGSSGIVLVPAKHGSADGHTLPSWNFLLDVVAGDYYEFVWSTVNTSVYISFQPAGTPPPSTASVVMTVTQQSGIMAGTGMTSLTTTGSSGASTYNSGTGALNVPTYTLSGLGGISGSGTTNYIPKFTGTSALGNSLIYDDGTNVSIGTTSGLGLFNVTGSKTAATAIARGVNFTPTLVAAANSDTLIGLDIAPTFTNGAFTGVTNGALRVNGNILTSSNGTNDIGSSVNQFLTTWSGTFRSISGGQTRWGATSAYNFYNSTNFVGQFAANTGNLLLQNGGTFTDVASSRLTINSTTQGMLPPRMTTAQKNAISSPATGLVVYDTDLKAISNYNGTSWLSLTPTAPSQQVYTGTITWTGTTAPSGATTHTYNWSLINNLVTLKITLIYATTGAGLTAVTVTLPNDCPTPLKPTGLTTASNNLYTGNAYLAQLITSTASIATRTILRSNAANNGFEIVVNSAAGTYAYSDIIVQYFTS